MRWPTAPMLPSRSLRRTSSHAKVILLTSTRPGQLFACRQPLATGLRVWRRAFTSYVDGEGAVERAPGARSAAHADSNVYATTSPPSRGVARPERRRRARLARRAPDKTESRVRHNLDRSLADQFEEALNGERVEELVVLAPFFDLELAALRDLIARVAGLRADDGHGAARTDLDRSGRP